MGSGNTASSKTSGQHFGTSQNKTPGELFLDGYAFGSRPSEISFYYRYDTVTSGNGDYGTIEVKVLDAAKQHHCLSQQQSHRAIVLYLNDTSAHLRRRRSQSCKNQCALRIKCQREHLQFRKHKQLALSRCKESSGGEYTGSELYIDDITLTY